MPAKGKMATNQETFWENKRERERWCLMQPFLQPLSNSAFTQGRGLCKSELDGGGGGGKIGKESKDVLVTMATQLSRADEVLICHSITHHAQTSLGQPSGGNMLQWLLPPPPFCHLSSSKSLPFFIVLSFHYSSSFLLPPALSASS